MPRCSYVIAFRSDDRTDDPGTAQPSRRKVQDEGPRRTNLAQVLRHITTIDDLEVIVVEQDTEPSFRRTSDSETGVGHVFLSHTGPFNKSWAMNVGFRASTAPVVAFGDADLIVATSAIVDAIISVEGGFDATKPFDRIVDLDESETTRFRHDGTLPQPTAPIEPQRRGVGEYLPFCGGLFIAGRDLIQEVGGYDERFVGWGGEDDALSVKLARSGARLGIAERQVAYHLWHDRQPSRYVHSSYEANVRRLDHLQRCGDEELRAIFARDAARMGDPSGPLLDS